MATTPDITSRLGLLLPNADHYLQDDVQRLIDTFNLLDVLVVKRDQTTGKIADDQLSDVIAKLTAGKLDASTMPASVVQKGTGGKIDAAVLPNIAIVQSFNAPDQSTMLALAANRGDIVVRQDTGRTFMLAQLPATTLGNWCELTATNVSSINGQTGAITGIAASGNNSDITGFTKKINFAAGARGSDATTNDGFITKQQFDAQVQNIGAGGYIGETWWHPTRLQLPDGTVPSDGQQIQTASQVYPEFVAQIVAGKWPVVTDSLWLSNPANRGCYTYDSASDVLRVPDLNGVQPGSLTAPFLRGGTQQDIAGNVVKGGVPNIKGNTGSCDNEMIYGGIKPPFYAFGTSKRGSLNDDTGGILGFDASLVSDVYQDGLTEVRPNFVSGCIVIRVATKAANQGSVDMLALQADVAALKAAAEATNADIGYAIVNFPTLTQGARLVQPNPFGPHTPVICQVQLFDPTSNQWFSTGYGFNYGANNSGGQHGSFALYSPGEGIVVYGGKGSIAGATYSVPANIELSKDLTSAACRVMIWSVGNNISKLKKMSEIDPALVAEFKSPARPTGLRTIWTRTATETGVTGKQFTLTESILGKTIYIGNLNNFSSTGILIPAVKPPHLTALTTPTGVAATSWEIFLTMSDSVGYRMQLNNDGTQLYLANATTNANAIVAIYVDDYTPVS